jgi:LPS sulfotransferase NodH
MNQLKLPTDFSTQIAPHDFCDPRFDNEIPHAGSLKTIYILLSTPRSGSTLFCEKVYQQTGLVIHEYLQSFQYVPFLAHRFNVVKETTNNGKHHRIISLKCYLQALVAARAQQGVLGINCHISHIIYLRALVNEAKRLYPDVQIEQDYLYRRNQYRQAASYAIAREKKIWSQLEATGPDQLSRKSLLKLKIQAALLLRKLRQQHQLIISEKLSLGESKPIIFNYCYEDIIAQGCDDNVITEIIDRLGISRNSPRLQLEKQLAAQATGANLLIAHAIRQHGGIYLALGFILNMLEKLGRISRQAGLTCSRKTKSIPYFLEIEVAL